MPTYLFVIIILVVIHSIFMFSPSLPDYGYVYYIFSQQFNLFHTYFFPLCTVCPKYVNGLDFNMTQHHYLSLEYPHIVKNNISIPKAPID